MISPCSRKGHTNAVLSLTAAIFAFWPMAGSVAVAAPDKAYDVPRTIPADQSKDVTEELNAFIKSVPDGSTIVFPKDARYKIEGTLLIENQSDLTVDGNGALFKSSDSLANYSKRNGAAEYKLWRTVRNRAHWRVKNSKNITIKNFEVFGPHTDANPEGTFDAAREAQHAIDVDGAKGLVIEKAYLHDLWGDGVYISGNSERVVIRDSKIQSTGRQGIAVAVAHDVQIENNDIGTSRRGLIDIEPFGKNWVSGDIRIIGNRFGSSRLLALPMGGAGSIGLVLVANNTFAGTNGVPLVYNRTDNEKAVRGPFVFANNTAVVSGSSTTALDFSFTSGIFIAGNRFLFPVNRGMTAIRMNKTSAGVFGNAFAGARQIFSQDEATAAGARSVASFLTDRGNAFPAWTAKSKEGTQRIKEGEAELKTALTTVKEISGGYAVQIHLNADTTAVAIVRSGGDLTQPRKLSAYGLETEAPMAWVYVEKGKVVESFVTEGGRFTYKP